MRHLFLCFLLVGLVWLIGQSPASFATPVAYAGILMVFPLLISLAGEKTGLPPYLAVLAAGFLMEPARILPPDGVHPLQPFTELATIWVGLYLGSALSPAILRDTRLVAAAGITVAATPLIALPLLLLALSLPAATALHLGILACLPAPFFVCISRPSSRESRALLLLVAGLGLALLSLFQALHTRFFHQISFQQLALDLLCWGLAIEALYQIARRLRTDAGRRLLFAGILFLIVIASRLQPFPTLFLALSTGFALSLRSGPNRAVFHILETPSRLLIPFILADFAVRLTPSDLPGLTPSHWQTHLVYAGSMIVGKTLSGILATRLTHMSFRHWIQLFPQGLLTATFFYPALPSMRAVPADLVTTEFIFICGIGIGLLIWPLRATFEHIEMERFTEPRADSGRRLPDT